MLTTTPTNNPRNHEEARQTEEAIECQCGRLPISLRYVETREYRNLRISSFENIETRNTHYISSTKAGMGKYMMNLRAFSEIKSIGNRRTAQILALLASASLLAIPAVHAGTLLTGGMGFGFSPNPVPVNQIASGEVDV